MTFENKLRLRTVGYSYEWFNSLDEGTQDRIKTEWEADKEIGQTNFNHASINGPNNDVGWLIDNYPEDIRDFAYERLIKSWMNGNKSYVQHRIMTKFEKPVVIDFIQWVFENQFLEPDQFVKLLKHIKRYETD